MSTHTYLPAGGFCIRNVNRDFVEWHQGRPRYVVWAIDVDLPVVQSRVNAAQAHLEGLLLEGYARQPHITLALCGFPGAQPLLPDEFGTALLARQVATLQHTPPAPFEVSVGALSSFASVPYLSVTDHSGGITHLRACLHADSNTQPYTPHVTVGLYAHAWPTDAVRPRLSAFSPGAAIPLQVTQIGLFAYQTSSIGGGLERLATYDLEEKHLRWQVAPVFPSESLSLNEPSR